MRRLVNIGALLGLLSCSLFAQSTAQQSFQQLGNSNQFALSINWTGDPVSGAVSPITGAIPLSIQGFRMIAAEFGNGTPAPTNPYSVTVTTSTGVDLLAGGAKSLSSTASSAVQALSTAPPINGILTLNVTNSAAGAKGNIILYFAPISQVFGIYPPATVTNGNGQGNGSGNATYCADATGSTTAYTCPNPSPAVTSLTGLFVTFVPQATNGAGPTLNVAGLGAIALKQPNGSTNVAIGTLIGGQAYFFTFNGTNFVQSAPTVSTNLSDTSNIVYTNLARTMAALLTIPGGDLFNGGVNAQSGANYAILAADDNRLVTFNNAGAVAATLPQATTAGFGNGFFVFLFNRGAGTVTITPNVSTINGSATLALAQNQGALIVSDGANYSAWFSANPTGAAAAAVVSTTFSATPTFTCPSVSQGTAVYFTLTTALTSNITGTYASCTPGSTVVIKFVQDGTGGRTASITNADTFVVHPALNIQTICVFTVEDSTHLKLDGCVSNAGYSFGQETSTPANPPPSGGGYTFGSSTNHIWCYENSSSTVSCTVVPATAAANQFVTSVTATGTLTFAQPNIVNLAGDFPDFHIIPAANCNNTTAGAGWSIGSGGTVTCRAGTNNKGGFISITDTSTTFATFQIAIPEDWDTGSNPFIRFQIASTDTTSGHTIIPSIQVACYKGDGTTTDDVAANAAHSLSTITTNTTANQFWSTSNVQMNATDVTGCVAGAMMQITVGRATDTATNAEFYSATITFPRHLALQAN